MQHHKNPPPRLFPKPAPSRPQAFSPFLLAALALLLADPARAQSAEPSWITPPVTSPGLEHHLFDSPAAGEKVSYLIYLPPDYKTETAAARRYPVLYWLHGIGGSQQGMPGFCERLTRAIEQGKTPPMLVVFVNGMVDSFYCDAATLHRPVETVIIRDLIPHIDATWRTLPAREARAIEGFSMGGFGAAHLGFKHPELFGAVSMIDAALIDLNTMKNRHAEVFSRVFNNEDETFTAAHPLTLATQNAAQIRDRVRIRQIVGPLLAPNSNLHEKLTALGLAHDYRIIDGAPHEHAFIYDSLGDDNWVFYTQAFASPPAAPVLDGVHPLNAHPGATITLTGRHLAGATVAIGGVTAHIIANTGDTLTLIAPAGTPGGTLTLTTPGGGITAPQPLLITPDAGQSGALLSPSGLVATSGSADCTLYVSDAARHTLHAIATASGSITPLAGSPGSPGLADGAGANARFNQPRALAINRAGALLLADTGNHRLRSITAAGAVTTTGATGADAPLASPAGLASVDAPSGETYIADTGNHLIKKITPAGEVRVVAGSATPGDADGPLLQARFNLPAGIAVDVTGRHLYVADTGNHTIRLIDLDRGVVDTLAGQPGIPGDANGPADLATFRAPAALIVDAGGDIHVADTGNHRIRLIVPDGPRTVSTSAGGAPGFVDGPGAAARFNTPSALALAEDGSLYVADTGNAAIRRIAPDAPATVTTLALKPAPAPPPAPPPPDGNPAGVSGGGGGGAPTLWLLAPLALLAAHRLRRRA